eukprot:TRINITY_DN24086_c1_g1_i1.p1 TRINITY_DN24086_c1_g1~~TRINITY_DN24086_c1_g1_i1.p1  ORF type:complete len:881 (+),score=99.93 TRINITY_DN24086_c1_g1_i1:77-2719(+)
MVLSVPVSSCVKIRNVRLGIVFRFLNVCTVILALVYLYSYGHHLSTVLFEKKFRVDTWYQDFEERGTWDEHSATQLCQASATYMYKYDDSNIYKPTECRQLCTSNRTNRCVSPNRAYVGDSDNTGLLVASYWYETSFVGNNVTQQTEYFLPEFLDIMFGMSFSVEIPPSSRFARFAGNSDEGNVVVVVVGSARDSGNLFQPRMRDVTRTFPSGRGQTITFKMRDLLELSGIEANLTKPYLTKRQNLAPVGPKYPIIGITGVTIELKIHCSDRWPRDVRGATPCNSNLHALCCVISFEPLPFSWGFSRTLDQTGPDTHTDIYRFGVRILPRGVAEFQSLDVRGLFVNLMSTIVFLNLPRICILFLITYCLGHVSRIYRRVIFREFDIETEVAGMGTRLLAGAYTFDALTGFADKLPRTAVPYVRTTGPLLAGDVVRTYLMFSMRERYRELHGDQLDAFISFVTESMQSQGSRGLHAGKKLWTDWCRAISCCESVDVGEGIEKREEVSIAGFEACLSSNEQIALDDLCRLFDASRRVGSLEQFFMPSGVKGAIFAANAGVKRVVSDVSERNSTESESMDGDERGPPVAVEPTEGLEYGVEELRREMNLRIDEMRRLIEVTLQKTHALAFEAASDAARKEVRLLFNDAQREFWKCASAARTGTSVDSSELVDIEVAKRRRNDSVDSTIAPSELGFPKIDCLFENFAESMETTRFSDFCLNTDVGAVLQQRADRPTQHDVNFATVPVAEAKTEELFAVATRSTTDHLPPPSFVGKCCEAANGLERASDVDDNRLSLHVSTNDSIGFSPPSDGSVSSAIADFAAVVKVSTVDSSQSHKQGSPLADDGAPLRNLQCNLSSHAEGAFAEGVDGACPRFSPRVRRYDL